MTTSAKENKTNETEITEFEEKYTYKRKESIGNKKLSEHWNKDTRKFYEELRTVKIRH